jgi:hypothetical protein
MVRLPPIAKQGVDETILNDGDQIAWNFRRYDSTTHGASRYAEIKKQTSKKE